MHYRDVIAEIAKRGLTKVLVTGPHRSGTTITAKILAHELGYRYVDECEIDVDSFEKIFRLYVLDDKFILQAPALSAVCHMFYGAVVFAMRPVIEIIRSQKRIEWNDKHELRKYFCKDGVIARIKYDIWHTYQKQSFHPHFDRNDKFEVDYHSIKDHPLYVPDELRKEFYAKQTEMRSN